MFFKTSDGQIIQTGHSWSQDGVTHPSNWEIWTPEYKSSMGLTEFTPDPQPDSRFYTWSQNEDLTYNKTEKSLTDTSRDDGTTKDGLKTVWIKESKATANSLLRLTDWQVIAKAERDRDIDEAVATYRAAVISACTTIEAAITGAADMAAFQALFDAPVDGNAPIHDWPDAID